MKGATFSRSFFMATAHITNGCCRSRLIELVHQGHLLQTGMTPDGPEIEQHYLATLVLQAQELPVKVGQLEIGGRLELVDGPEAGSLYQRYYRGRDDGLSMQEDHKPYHNEA